MGGLDNRRDFESASYVNGRRSQAADGVKDVERQFPWRSDKLTAIKAASDELTDAARDWKSVLSSVMDKVREEMRADAGGIYLIDSQAKLLSLASYFGIPDEFAARMSRIRLSKSSSHVVWVANSGEPLILERVREDPRVYLKSVVEQGIVSESCLPLKYAGQVVGVMLVCFRRYRTFSAEDKRFLEIIANQLSMVIHYGQLYEEQQKAMIRLQILEERYRSILDNTSEAIIMYELGSSKIIKANFAAARLTGYSMSEMIGMECAKLLSKSSHSILTDMENDCLRHRRLLRRRELTFVQKGGSTRVAEVGAALVSSEEQPLIELMAQDVTGVRQWQNYAQSLVAHITTVQEEERKWVAQEIHDETIQTLLAVSHQLDDLKNSIKGSMPGQVIEHLDGVRALTLQAINDLRRLCQGLRPAILDDMGLIRALTWLADSAAQEAGITVHIMVKGTHRRLPPHVELGLFRIAQEAIRNIKRHSRASEATVIVKFGRADIRMSIKDNGIGFKVPKSMAELVFQGKLGLLGMKERARLINGVLRIYSSEAQGTRASVKVPY